MVRRTSAPLAEAERDDDDDEHGDKSDKAPSQHLQLAIDTDMINFDTFPAATSTAAPTDDHRIQLIPENGSVLANNDELVGYERWFSDSGGAGGSEGSSSSVDGSDFILFDMEGTSNPGHI